MTNRLLLFNLATDADDPVLGFTTAWVNGLAARFDAVDVITMRTGRLAVADNVCVFSVGKEHGYSEARRTLEFYRLLSQLTQQNTYRACFAHMMPLFAVMAAPVLSWRGVPLTLWYTHKSVTPKLRLAEQVSHHVVTASPESFRLKSDKVIVVGHGIDTDLFRPSPQPRPADQPLTLVSVGRVAPSKQTHLLIEVARQLPGDFRLKIVGDAEPQHAGYLASLRQSAGDNVVFTGAVQHGDVATIYQNADAMLNISQTGSLDKAVLEAMACGLPVVTGNEAFRDMLAAWSESLLVPIDDPAAIAAKIQNLAQLSTNERAKIGNALRQIVVENHSFERLMDRLYGILTA